jgi:hypothetical protein
MGAARTHLTAGEWAVLGLLDETPAHGFASTCVMPAPCSCSSCCSSAGAAAEGFERGLLLWRRYNTAAAVQFTEAMLSERTLTEP